MTLTSALLRWLERVFFGGAELSVLSTPAFAVVAVLQARHPDAVSLAGLCAIAAGSVAVAVFRARRIDVGAWPRRAELTTIPLRVAYFSLIFFAASIGVALLVVRTDAWLLTLLGGVVQAAGMAAFPTVYRLIHGEPVRKPSRRV